MRVAQTSFCARFNCTAVDPLGRAIRWIFGLRGASLISWAFPNFAFRFSYFDFCDLAENF